MRLFVWDWPVRVFHWSMVACVVTCFVSGLMGGNAMEWHERSGYVVLGLLSFRFLWAFVGGTYARFTSYLGFPKRVREWLQGHREFNLGYTPMGTLALIALFTFLWAQTVTGLFANDGIMLEGPLVHLVPSRVSDMLTAWHKRGLYILGGLLALHVSAVLYYRLIKKLDYVTPLLTGYKEAPEDTPPELEGRAGNSGVALVLAVVVAGAVWYVVTQL